MVGHVGVRGDFGLCAECWARAEGFSKRRSAKSSGSCFLLSACVVGATLATLCAGSGLLRSSLEGWGLTSGGQE